MTSIKNPVVVIAKKTITRLASFWSAFHPLTAAEKEFIQINLDFWKENKQKHKVSKNRYVLIVPESYPLILVGNAHIASFIAEEKGLRPLFLVPSRFHRGMRKVLSSFPDAAFIYENDLNYLFLRIHSYFKARRLIRKLKGPEDVLELKFDGIRAGDLIYDSFLTDGFATLSDAHLKNKKLKRAVARFFYIKGLTKDIVKKYKIDVALLSHAAGVKGGVFYRYLLDSGIPVWLRGGTLRKYGTADMIRERATMRHENVITPERRYIDFMKTKSDYFLPLADTALDKRLSNEAFAYKRFSAYSVEKKIFCSKEELSGWLKLDVNKKNVFVMLHAFNDFPHTYGSMIYKDYYEWFENVLTVCKEVSSVNWIFKEHPHSKYYFTEDLDLKGVFSGINLPHVRFISASEDFNTASLKHTADVVLTCIGTAGLEYSAFGIPCVLGGNAFYSGYGFTIEPKTDAEFQDILRSINLLPRLSEEQITMAKLVAFFVFELAEATKIPDPFRTVCSCDIDEQKNLTAEEAFRKIISGRIESSQEDKNNYVNSLKEFIDNDDFTQFIDLDKYKIFRDIL